MLRPATALLAAALAVPSLAQTSAVPTGPEPSPPPSRPGTAAPPATATPTTTPSTGTAAAAPPTPAPPARASTETSAPIIVEHEAARSPLETVAIGAVYGAAAGAIVGVGIALIDQGNNWARDLTLGAGAGILVGAVVGGIQAYGQSNGHYATDGLGSPERDRAAARPARTVLSLGGRF